MLLNSYERPVGLVDEQIIERLLAQSLAAELGR
jgi:hypothetical protein